MVKNDIIHLVKNVFINFRSRQLKNVPMFSNNVNYRNALCKAVAAALAS